MPLASSDAPRLHPYHCISISPTVTSGQAPEMPYLMGMHIIMPLIGLRLNAFGIFFICDICAMTFTFAPVALAERRHERPLLSKYLPTGILLCGFCVALALMPANGFGTGTDGVCILVFTCACIFFSILIGTRPSWDNGHCPGDDAGSPSGSGIDWDEFDRARAKWSATLARHILPRRGTLA